MTGNTPEFRPITKSAFALALMLSAAACGDFPKIESATPSGWQAADFPGIAPIDGLLIIALGPSHASGEVVDPAKELARESATDARLLNLIARARLMRGAPVNSETSALLAAMN
jgi:hypothetical protein